MTDKSHKKSLEKYREEKKKDAKIIEELRRQLKHNRVESRDRATQSSGERRQTTNIQEEAVRRFMEKNEEKLGCLIQLEHHYPPTGDRHYARGWVI